MGASAQLTLRGRHVPALDGLRALAIAAVVAYHLGAGWLPGGYLGVDLFFVLSGFLITSLLVEERLSAGRVRLLAFWGRRARRLLPGLLLMLVALGAFLLAAGPGPLVDLGALRGDAVATVFYVANWHQLLAHQSYFDQFAAPSPLQHTWSLGIEEQFYLLWPALLGLVAWRSNRGSRRRGLVLACCGAAASAGWAAWLATHGASMNRLYYGTDTRAVDLLVGAALALFVAGRPQPAGRSRPWLAAGSGAGLAVFALMCVLAGGTGGVPGRWMFEWGFVLTCVAVALVVADARQLEPSALGTVLGSAPLRFVGTISYELYLWHWPVICELTPARAGFGGAGLDALRIAASVALATSSYYLVDRPIRRSALSSWPRRLRLATAPTAMVLALAVMVGATVPAAVAAPVAHLESGPSVPGAGHVVGGPIVLSRRPTRRHRLRVVLFGDSVMKGEAPAVVASLSSTGAVTVDDQAFDGWGLTTDHGWRTGVPAAIAHDHAELVVAMWSFDDNFLLAHPLEYHRWLASFVRLVISQPGVAGLVFEQFPQLGPPPVPNPVDAAAQGRKRNAGVDAWNRLARSLVRLAPEKVMYLPVAGSVERAGRYEAWLPPGNRFLLPARRWVRVRAVDAVHFCPAGAARYADALMTDLRSLYHLPAAAPAWSAGSWTRNLDYELPAGNCPSDHPS